MRNRPTYFSIKPTNDAKLFKCMLNHCLEWAKWVLTNFVHDRQWFNTLIPPSHKSAAVYFVCRTFGNFAPSGTAISRLNGPVRLLICYTTPDIHCRDRRYHKCDGGIKNTTIIRRLNAQFRNMQTSYQMSGICNKKLTTRWEYPNVTTSYLFT